MAWATGFGFPGSQARSKPWSGHASLVHATCRSAKNRKIPKPVARHTELLWVPNRSRVTLWGIPLFIEPFLSQNSAANFVISDKDVRRSHLWRLIGVQIRHVPLFSRAHGATRDLSMTSGKSGKPICNQDWMFVRSPMMGIFVLMSTPDHTATSIPPYPMHTHYHGSDWRKKQMLVSCQILYDGIELKHLSFFRPIAILVGIKACGVVKFQCGTLLKLSGYQVLNP
jgi:hypothetical protein